MPTVAANGLEVSYTVEGAGPPLVLLHGASSSALEDWAAQRPAFRAGFKLYLVDARGHAGTRWDAADGWSRDMLVDDLLAFADALGLATFHVAGFSMGAMTALTFATRFPERLRTAIVAGIDIEREPRASVAARLMDPERIERDEPAWGRQLEKRHDPVQGPGAWQRLMRAMAADTAIQPLLTPAELGRARLPTLLAYGDRDVFVPAEHAVKLHRQLPDSRLLIVPDSRHVVIASQPSIFNAAAASFWRSTESVARARAAAAGDGPPAAMGASTAVEARVERRVPGSGCMALNGSPPDARVRVETGTPDGPVGSGVAVLTIDRPEVLNALDAETMRQLVAALDALDDDPGCRCIVITGAGERAFAAGADIAEMADATPDSLAAAAPFERWDHIGRLRTPTIAAVRGYALGGGFELALACDMLVAADDAVFGQPEIGLGIIPGAGGSQRLTRAIGKARAMELVLTGRRLQALEAERLGLVTRLVPAAETVSAALGLAAAIASMPPLAVMAAADVIAAAEELPLSEGLALERRTFEALFATEDQKEGMRAFLEKRKPVWRGR